MKEVSEGETKTIVDKYRTMMNLPPEVADQLWADLTEAAKKNSFTKAWNVLNSYPAEVALDLQRLRGWEPTKTEAVYIKAFGGMEGAAIVDLGSRT